MGDTVCVHRYTDTFIHYRLDKVYVKLIAQFPTLCDYIIRNDDGQRHKYPYRPALHREYILYFYERLKINNCGLENIDIFLKNYGFIVLFDSNHDAYVHVMNYDLWKSWMFNARQEIFNDSVQYKVECEKNETSEQYFYNIWLCSKLLHS